MKFTLNGIAWIPNINYMHVQAKTNAIVVVIYFVNVLYTYVLDKRVDKDFGPLINDIWDSGTEHIQIYF